MVCLAPALAAAALLPSATLLPAGAGAAKGDLVVADFNAFGGSGGLIRVDAATGARTTLSGPFAPPGGPAFLNPADVEVEPGGRLVVAEASSFDDPADVNARLIRVDPVTGARTTLSANDAPFGEPTFSDPSGLAIAPDGSIFVAERDGFDDGDGGMGGGGVIRVDPVTGARTSVSSNAQPAGGPAFVEPSGIALAPDGSLLVADENAFDGSGAVIRVDPATGARMTVSANGAPAGGPSFDQPVGIAIEADGDLLVTDEDGFGGTGGVIRVDVATGARSTVSVNGAPAGEPDFAQPYGSVLDPAGDLLVADFDAFGGEGGVIGVDPATGARSPVSANGVPPGGPDFFDPLAVALLPAPAPPLPAPTPPQLAPPAPRVDRTAPVIRAAAVRPRRFVVGPVMGRVRPRAGRAVPARSTARRRGRRARRGTSFRYRLSEPARVRFAIARLVRGYRVGGRCRRQRRSSSRRRPCRRVVRVGGFSQRGQAGRNRRRFGGRLRGRRLRPGIYRATLRARDVAGNRSRPRRVGFRVLRR
ncbi:MAG: hypothetical protein ACR2GL_08750 [Thermoleophilaceae bacterium]